MVLSVIARVLGRAAAPVAKASIKSLAKASRPALKKTVGAAKNVATQSVRVLTKKSRLARIAKIKSVKFWRRGVKRVGSISSKISSLKKQIDSNPALKSILQAQIKTLQKELEAYQHLKGDEDRIGKEYSRVRKTDLRPLLSHANHLGKLILMEDKKGAVEPRLLQEYENYEKRIFQRLAQEEQFEKSAEKDEFSRFDELLTLLQQEISQLQGRANQPGGDRKEINREMRELLVEVRMIQHLKHATSDADARELQLSRKTRGVYNNLVWLDEFRQKEEQLARQQVA